MAHFAPSDPLRTVTITGREFSIEDLSSYLEHLNSASSPRGRCPRPRVREKEPVHEHRSPAPVRGRTHKTGSALEGTRSLIFWVIALALTAAVAWFVIKAAVEFDLPVAILIAWRTKNTLLTIGAGMLALLGITLLMGQVG